MPLSHMTGRGGAEYATVSHKCQYLPRTGVQRGGSSASTVSST